MVPRDLLADSRQQSLTALLYAIRKLCPDGYVLWGMPALRDELQERVGPVGEITLERIAAIRVAISTPDVLTDWPVFENVAQAFSWQKPVFGALQSMLPEMAAVTLREIYRLRNQVPEQVGFPLQEVDEELLRFVAAVFLQGGFWYIPTVAVASAYVTSRGLPAEDVQALLPYFAALAGVQPFLDRFAKENDAYRDPQALVAALNGATKGRDSIDAFAVESLGNFVDNLLAYEHASAKSYAQMTTIL